MILSRVKFYPQERVDLEDLLTLLSGARTDAKLWTKQVLSGENYILKGFTVSGLGLKAATVEMDNATMFLGQGTQDFSYFIAENSPTDLIVSDSDLVDGARNYVELALTYEDGTPITKAFWDPSANGGLGAEFNQQVNTVTDLQATTVVVQGGFTGSPDRLPLCIIDTDVSGTIKLILDRRNLFFRLGSPADPDQGFTWTSNEEPGYSVNLTGVSGTFTDGETVTFSGGATATVATGGTSNIVIRLPSSLSFASGNTLTGGSSGATGTVNTILEAFGGSDKDIDDFREMFMALATEIRRIKGTAFWPNIQGNSMDGISSIMNMAIVGLTAGARWSWSGTALSITDNNGTPAATDDLARIRLFGKAQDITLRRADGTASTSTIPIADGEILYVKLPASGDRNFSGNGNGDTDFQVVAHASYVINDTNFWLAYRDGAKLYVRGYGELMTGESAEISDPISEQILTFIGATSEADDAPNYTSANIVTQGSSLVNAISELDAFSTALTWKAPVANFAALPGSGNTDGDARITLDTRIIYTWVAADTEWRPITGGGGVKIIGGGVVTASGGLTPATLKSSNVVNTSGAQIQGGVNRLLGPTWVSNKNGQIEEIDISASFVSGTGNAYIDVYALPSPGAIPVSGPIATSNPVDITTMPATLTNPATLTTFTFASPITIVNGTEYAFVARNDGVIGEFQVNYPTSLDTDPSLGRLFQFTGTGGWIYDNTDMDLEIRGQEDTGYQIAFTADMYLEMKGLAYTDNTIQTSESPIIFTNDYDVAYVLPNFTAGGPDLTVTVDTLDNVPPNAVIIARREGTTIIVGSSSTRLLPGQSSELYAQESVQTRNTIRSFDYLRSDEPVTWTGSQVQFTQDIVLEQLNTRLGTTRLRTILVANSPIVINDGQVLYVEVDRAAANGNVTPQVSSSVPTPDSESTEIVIIAKRIDVSGAGYLHLPLHKQVLNPGQTVRLGASGSGSDGDAVGTSPIDGYQWRESDSFDVLPSSSDSKVTLTNYTNASFNIAKGLFRISCDKSKTISSNTGTSITISADPGFTVAVGDIVYVTSGARSGQWRRITAIITQQSYTLDAAFTGGDATLGDTLMVSQAVWSKDLVNFGSASEKTRARDFFSGNITQIAIAYEDSVTVDDDIANLADAAYIVAGASNEGLLAASGVPVSSAFGDQIYTRPTGAAQINDFVLSSNSDQERLHLAFFCSPTNGSVTTGANLLGYEANFYVEDTQLNSGTLENAICFSDASSTAYNCSVATPASLTRVTMTWSYVPAVKSGSPDGQLKVIVDGKEISRYISSAITPTSDLYYTEVAGSGGVYNVIEFTKDLSGSPLEIKVRKQFGVIDSSTTNNAAIALLGTVPTVTRLTSGSGTYNTPANVRYIRVRMIGGGGGGSGTSNGTPATGGSGGNSTFGGILSANGGTGGGTNGPGGAGGSTSVTSPAISFVQAIGGDGGNVMSNQTSSNLGGIGGSGYFGGAGSPSGGTNPGVGNPGKANTGGGGGGGSQLGAFFAGAGGGSGGYVEAIIVPTALQAFSYAVGAGGTAGTGGSGAGVQNGGAGGSGVIIIEEYY